MEAAAQSSHRMAAAGVRATLKVQGQLDALAQDLYCLKTALKEDSGAAAFPSHALPSPPRGGRLFGSLSQPRASFLPGLNHDEIAVLEESALSLLAASSTLPSGPLSGEVLRVAAPSKRRVQFQSHSRASSEASTANHVAAASSQFSEAWHACSLQTLLGASGSLHESDLQPRKTPDP
jgi:hypothetical protein